VFRRRPRAASEHHRIPGGRRCSTPERRERAPNEHQIVDAPTTRIEVDAGDRKLQVDPRLRWKVALVERRAANRSPSASGRSPSAPVLGSALATLAASAASVRPATPARINERNPTGRACEANNASAQANRPPAPPCGRGHPAPSAAVRWIVSAARDASTDGADRKRARGTRTSTSVARFPRSPGRSARTRRRRCCGCRKLGAALFGSRLARSAMIASAVWWTTNAARTSASPTTPGDYGSLLAAGAHA
jgi:hypothetical protein